MDPVADPEYDPRIVGCVSLSMLCVINTKRQNLKGGGLGLFCYEKWYFGGRLTGNTNLIICVTSNGDPP